jgi:hypothetical protein
MKKKQRPDRGTVGPWPRIYLGSNPIFLAKIARKINTPRRVAAGRIHSFVRASGRRLRAYTSSHCPMVPAKAGKPSPMSCSRWSWGVNRGRTISRRLMP